MTPQTLRGLAGSAPSWPQFARVLYDPQGADAGAAATPASTAERLEAAHKEVIEDSDDTPKPPPPTKDDTPPDEGEDDEDDEDQETEPGEGTDPPSGKKDGTPTPTPSETADPLSAEDKRLLERNGADADEIAEYEAMEPARREKALRPLRRAQLKLNATHSQPDRRTPEGSGQAAGQPGQEPNASPGAPPKKDPHKEAATQRVRTALKGAEGARPVFDAKVIDAIAEAEGLKRESVETLATHLSEAITTAQMQRLEPLIDLVADQVAERDRDAESAAASDRTRTVEAAAARARDELAKDFPKLKDDEEYGAVVNDPAALAMFSANIAQGQSVAAAMRGAIEMVATKRYLPDLRTQHTQAAERRARQRTAGTGERGSGGKPPAPGPAPLTGSTSQRVEQAHSKVTAR